MTDEEGQKLKDCLIEAGFWSAEDLGDPVADEDAIGFVLDRMYKRLAPGVVLNFFDSSEEQTGHEVQISWEGGQHALAINVGLNEVICDAVQALPKFLEEHPECAVSAV